jgi:hypothetical protein
MAAKVHFFTVKGVLGGTSSLYGASSAYKIENDSYTKNLQILCMFNSGFYTFRSMMNSKPEASKV